LLCPNREGDLQDGIPDEAKGLYHMQEPESFCLAMPKEEKHFKIKK